MNYRTFHPSNPPEEMLTLGEAMRQVLENSVVRPGSFLADPIHTAGSFPVNVRESADEATIEAFLPGVSLEDVDVSFEQGILTITAQRHVPSLTADQTWYLREFYDGQFTRSFALPFPVAADQVQANLADGILTLQLPKAEEAKPKRLAITSGQREQLSSGAAA
jgi:HSP20 family protein